MTDEKILDMAAHLWQWLSEMNVGTVKAKNDGWSCRREREEALCHACHILVQVPHMVRDNRRDEALLHIGRAQGIVWGTGDFGSEDLKRQTENPVGKWWGKFKSTETAHAYFLEAVKEAEDKTNEQR